MFLSEAGGDPLSALLSESNDVPPLETAASAVGSRGSATKPGQEFLDVWAREKESILSTYTLTGKIKVAEELLQGTADGAAAAAQAPRKVNESRSKARLVELGDEKHEKDKREVSQKEYMTSINRLHDEIAHAWKSADRASALRRAVACAGMLGDTSNIGFYPSVFVLVTDILDSFAVLVYDRLRERATALRKKAGQGPLPDDFRPEDVPQEARETARNWFYKVVGVPDLVSRLYMELALTPCLRFIGHNREVPTLLRVCAQARGLGDPIVAAYARAYLLRVGAGVVAPEALVDPAERAFDDFVASFNQYKERRLTREAEAREVSTSELCGVLGPALNWIGRFLAIGATREKCTMVLGQFRDSCGVTVALRPLVVGFSPALVSAFATRIVAMTKEAEELGCGRCDVFVSLGQKLLECPPPADQKLSVLNEVWKVVRTEPDTRAYARCTVCFVRVLLAHYSDREVLILLKDLARHTAARPDDVGSILPELEAVVEAVVASSGGGFGAIVSSEHFLSILDAFKSERKTKLCKALLGSFVAETRPTSDPVLVHTLFEVGRTLHDSLDSLSFEDERRQVSRLVCAFVSKIDFGKNLEQQMNVYIDCRAAFVNLDAVVERLVCLVASLAMRALRLSRGRHTKKTQAFAKAALAFCHITIPSLDSPLRRLQLAIHCATVALASHCLPQADTFFKQAISLLPDVPATVEMGRETVATESWVLSAVASLLSALVVAPGHPDQGPMYFARGLVKALQAVPWAPRSAGHGSALVLVLRYLASQTQARLPYHVPRLDSNDTLFASSTEAEEGTRRQIDAVLVRLLEVIEAGVKATGDAAWADGAGLAIEALEALVGCYNLGEKKAATVTTQLVKVGAQLVSREGSAALKRRFAGVVQRLQKEAERVAAAAATVSLEDDTSGAGIYRKLTMLAKTAVEEMA